MGGRQTLTRKTEPLSFRSFYSSSEGHPVSKEAEIKVNLRVKKMEQQDEFEWVSATFDWVGQGRSLRRWRSGEI